MARATRPKVLRTLIKKLWLDHRVDKGGAELMVPCPFCGTDSPKCAINPDKGVFQCWVCGERGPTGKLLYHLKDIGSIRQRDIDAVMVDKKAAPKLSDLKPIEAEEVEEVHFWTEEIPCVFPKGVFALYDPRSPEKMAEVFYKRALAYLKGRGVTASDIRRYRLHLCVRIGSPYHGHIFIPCLGKFGREMTFWTTRSILADPETKSFHSGHKYSRFSAKHVLMNEHLVVDTTIAVCEGPFDAFAIMRRTGIPAIPLLGKVMHKRVKAVMREKGIDKVYLCLDSDAASTMANLGLGLKKDFNPMYVYLDDGDPDDVTPDELRAAFENATPEPKSKMTERVSVFRSASSR